MFSARMTPERKELLNRSLCEAISQQPESERLKELLLNLGGEFLVAPPKPDQGVPMLLERGFLMSGRIMLNVMESSSRHRNVASIWIRKEFGNCRYCDWRCSKRRWAMEATHLGILRDGVLETTEERLKYFGLLFQGKTADFFAEINSG